MSLGSDQKQFTFLISKLIQWAYDRGYEITCGDFWAEDGHSKDSFHYKRLAADLNLFMDGTYLKDTKDHEPLGMYWKSLNPKCTWGG
jgi:hypothetical protein